jgi:cytochrome c peroxidase
MWFDAPVPVDPIDLTDEGEYGPLGSAYFQDSIRLARNFDTAALANVYAAPPFLHNGAAVSLAEIWTRYNLYQKHGVTHDLTRRQLNDLVAYLRTL